MTDPRPVRFDHEAARQAVNQIFATAESMVEVLSVLDADNATVTEDWTGRFRDTFDFEYDYNVLVGGASVQMLYQMAAVIQARSTEALAANILYNRWLEDQGEEDGGG